MNVWIVRLRNDVGREREERIVASSGTSACTQAILRVQRETGAKDWYAVTALEA